MTGSAVCGKRSGQSLREDGAGGGGGGGGGDSKTTILCIPHSFVENKGIGTWYKALNCCTVQVRTVCKCIDTKYE